MHVRHRTRSQRPAFFHHFLELTNRSYFLAPDTPDDDVPPLPTRTALIPDGDGAVAPDDKGRGGRVVSATGAGPAPVVLPPATPAQHTLERSEGGVALRWWAHWRLAVRVHVGKGQMMEV